MAPSGAVAVPRPSQLSVKLTAIESAPATTKGLEC